MISTTANRELFLYSLSLCSNSTECLDVVSIVNPFCLGMPRAPVVGKVVVGQVKKVLPHEGLLVCLPGHTGRVDITDVSDHFTDHPLSGFRKSQFVKCVCVCVCVCVCGCCQR